ncbi:MAG: SpoVR family protein, partial [Bdellovibrionota bacterium]
MSQLPPELDQAHKLIKSKAAELGLDFFDVVFELVSAQHLNEVAARGGFPVRYPHWRFGMDFESLSKSYEYGLSKIYELVINNDPCYAYLVESNDFVDQKLVMAHVFAHGDFFKNNAWFKPTNRKLIAEMGNHAAKV